MTMDSEIIVRAEQLSKTVDSPAGALTILDNISFSIHRAEAVAIVGASGSGKTTLLGLLAGIDTPSSGHNYLNETDLSQLDEDGRALLRGQWVGFVFQSFHLLPNLTALENVMLPLELSEHPQPRHAAETELSTVGLAKRIDHYPHQLSGGEQQRVAIARAYARRPKVLFADEPTGNLDGSTGDKVSRLLFSLQQEYATTLVLVTHDTALTENCSRILRLDNGRLDNDNRQ